MRHSKGPITSSAFNKMRKKFEATGCWASRQRSGNPSTVTAVATTVEKTLQSMSAIAAHGQCSAWKVSRQIRVLYGSVWRALRIALRRYPCKNIAAQELESNVQEEYRLSRSNTAFGDDRVPLIRNFFSHKVAVIEDPKLAIFSAFA
ncbi:transposable element tc3 transposase [Trichonephila clavipes]|nr:transposable element tc3 transposase [Trichonephila clavipes]